MSHALQDPPLVITQQKNKEIHRANIAQAIGRGYRDFWFFRGRYRIVKGSRASKKSKTMALWIIYNMMKYLYANTLVVRKTFSTLKNSCFAELKWAAERLGVAHLWKFTTNPLEATYLPTGQKIYFRGLDDPLKITSITADVGVLCWLWIEEGYEIKRMEDFDMLDESIRGQTPDGLFKQITITMNPWSDRHWIKERFFDVEDPEVLAKTTTYHCNEWLDEADYKIFERMKKQNPARYKVAGLGQWGLVHGLVYENWVKDAFDVQEITKRPTIRSCFGLDFGYTNDPTALFCGLIDTDHQELYVFDEHYERGMSNEDIAKMIANKGYLKEKIVADSAEPKSIARIRKLGVSRIAKSRKGRDSVKHGIDYLQDFQIYIHPRCINFLDEIGNYSWDEDKFGNKVNRPRPEFDHLMDAMRYATEEYARGERFSFI